MSGHLALTKKLLNQLTDWTGNRTVELNMWWDLDEVERFAKMRLRRLGEDGVPSALLRRLIGDCKRLRSGE